MTKQELIANLAADTSNTKAATEDFLAGFLRQVTAALAKGDSVVLPGFGTFEVRARNARSGRNPQTGETIAIAASKAAAFKPAAALKKAIAEG